MSEQNETHTHVLADGTIVEHTHGEPQESHTHVSEDGTIVEHTHGEPQETHTHVLEDGTVIEHTHGEHGHSHSHAHTKAVINRLSRAIGHLESIRRMVENGRDCTEVLIQLSAVKSAINNTGKIILQDHIEHCIVDAVEHDDREALKELERAIDRFMK